MRSSGSSPARRVALLAAALACALAMILRLDFGPLPEVTRFRDDAYYYFVWARSLASGQGPVVSDGTWTSGVHVLWGFLLAGCGWLIGAAAIPAAAHLLGLGLHAATAASWLRLPGALKVRATMALLYLGNPFLLSEAQNGQETALACFLLLLLWQARRAPPVVFTGLGLMLVLARSDLWGVLLCLSVWRGWLRGRLPRELLPPLIALAVHLAINRALGGGLLQDSAAPVPWLLRANFLATEPGPGEVLHHVWWYLRPVLLGGPWALTNPLAVGALVFLLVRPLWPRRWRFAPLAGVALATPFAGDLAVPLCAASLLALLPRGRRRRPRGDLTALTLGLCALMVLHYVLREYPRDYYFAPVGVAAAAALWRLRRLSWLLVLAALVHVLQALQPAAGRPWQQEMSMAGRFLERILPEGEKVGCFNAGLVAWHHAGPVVNLDGSVDYRAFAALRAGALDAFLDLRDVRFLVDNPAQFALDPRVPHATGPRFGSDFDPQRDLREIARFDVPGVDSRRPRTDSFRLYWRVGRGRPPPRPTRAEVLGRAPDGAHYVLWPSRPGVTLSVGRDRDTARPLVVGAGHSAQVLRVRVADRDSAARLWASDREEAILVLRAR